jgi:pyruvate kinase
MRRYRNAKILATLGPSSADERSIEKLFVAGVDVFRLNFSHGSHEEHLHRLKIIRALERKYHRPITILGDLQGPKLRVGTFSEGRVQLKAGNTFSLDLNGAPGNVERINFPHGDIYKCLKPGHNLLLDDGKIRLKVKEATPQSILCEVIIGGELSNRKGVNIPDASCLLYTSDAADDM